MTVAHRTRIFQTPPVADSAQNDAETDVEVLRRVAQGEREALGILYDRHAGLMLALALRILGVRRDAEDLLHDVFLEAWRHAGDYDATRGSVRNWLLLRMRSRSLDRARSHAFSKSDALLPEQAETARTSAQDRLELRIDAARARELLDALPEAQRQVLELGYLEGLSFTEIADTLGIPVGTVKSRVSAAMIKLREGFGVRKEAS